MRSARVRAVVLNYGQPLATAACVRSVLAQTWRPLDVVVVDNFSSHDTVEALRRALPPQVHLVLNPENVGYSAGNNAGCRSTACPPPDYVLVLNNDVTLPHPDDLARLVAALQADRQVVAASPLVHTLSDSAPATHQIQVRRDADYLTCLVAGSWWLRRIPGLRRVHRAHVYEDWMPFQADRAYTCDSINGSCFLIDFGFLTSIGYFDEGTFLYFEEVILGRQIRQRGMHCALVTGVCVEHHQGLSTGQRGASLPLDMYVHTVNSQLHYCRRYLRVGVLGRALLVAVRALDYSGKALVGLAFRLLPHRALGLAVAAAAAAWRRG